MTELSDLEFAILAFERRRWNHQGAKGQAVKDTFDLSRTRYEQLRGLLPATSKSSLTIVDESNNKIYLAVAKI